jgi:hypothetical protein
MILNRLKVQAEILFYIETEKALTDYDKNLIALHVEQQLNGIGKVEDYDNKEIGIRIHIKSDVASY